MPYIKVPEFKHGETIKSSDFNDATTEIKDACKKLDGLNFSDQAFGQDEVPVGVSLRDSEYGDRNAQFTGSVTSISHGGFVDDLFSSYHDDGFIFLETHRNLNPSFNWPFKNYIRLKNLQAGEKVIIRASFRINIPDMAARTYMYGRPATLKAALVRVPLGSDLSTGDAPLYSTILRPTEQHFRFAFTDKMPSASSLSSQALAHAAPVLPWENFYASRDSVFIENGPWYRDNRGGSDDNPDDDYDAHHPTSAGTLNFPSQFNYTTCYLYEHPSEFVHNVTETLADQQFIIKVWLGGMNPGRNDDPDSELGGKGSGCLKPLRLPIEISDFDLHCYPVRR